MIRFHIPLSACWKGIKARAGVFWDLKMLLKKVVNSNVPLSLNLKLFWTKVDIKSVTRDPGDHLLDTAWGLRTVNMRG